MKYVYACPYTYILSFFLVKLLFNLNKNNDNNNEKTLKIIKSIIFALFVLEEN